MKINFLFILFLQILSSFSKTCIDIFRRLGLDVNELNIDTSHQCHENNNNEAISLELLNVDLSKGDIDVIFETSSLEILKLTSSNTLIPNKFDKLPNLVEIFISNINYESFPDSIFKLVNLKKLSLNYCGFSNIPNKFDKISNLTTIRLSGNKFEYLPNSIYELKNLTTIELNENPNFKGMVLKNSVIESAIKEDQLLELDENQDTIHVGDNSKNEEKHENNDNTTTTTTTAATTSTANSNYKNIDILSINLKKAIDEHDVISFDIFDTLLVRPYMKSTDLFRHLEQLYNVTGFFEKRTKVEREVRRMNYDIKDDITLDEIYEQIGLEYQWLKEKELSLEYQVSSARLYMKDIYDYACQENKIIIIISDSNLSKPFLIDLLKKNGYIKIDHLFVSSEYGQIKGTGILYNKAIEVLQVSEKNILHIGNNMYSDINRPRKLGISAFYVPKVSEVLFKTDTRMEAFYNNHKEDLGTSIMLSLLAYHSEHSYQNYWYELGYNYAGPVIFGFMQWLDLQMKKDEINQAFFIGRDGYTLEKVFKLINGNDSEVQTYYVYLPRNIAHGCLNEDLEIAEKSQMEYRQYLEQFDIHNYKKLAVIDSVTYWYSSQRTLVRLLPDKLIKGYYWIYGNTIYDGLNCEAFQKDQKHIIGEIIELFMTAPTPPIKTILNGQPVFEEVTDAERVRIELYPDLSKGAVDFAQDFIKKFKQLNGYFTSEMLVDWLKGFIQRPTEIDKISFFDIEHAADENHTSYQKLMYKWY